jgi:hypothetical protein
VKKITKNNYTTLTGDGIIRTHWFEFLGPIRALCTWINICEPCDSLITMFATFARADFEDFFWTVGGEKAPPADEE